MMNVGVRVSCTPQQGLQGGGLGALRANILFSATRWPIAPEELIAASTATTPATKKSGQTISRNRADVDKRFEFVMESPVVLVW